MMMKKKKFEILKIYIKIIFFYFIIFYMFYLISKLENFSLLKYSFNLNSFIFFNYLNLK
jgi:hypothetical protein